MKNILSSTLALLLLSATVATAQTIIYDDFSNPVVPTGTPDQGYGDVFPAGTSVDISGLSPANGSTSGNYVAGTDLPGGTWIENGGTTNDGFALEVAGTLNLASGGSVDSYAEVGYHRSSASLSLGSYNTSPTLTISAYISPTTAVSGYFDNDGEPDGALLGFSNSTSGSPGTVVGILLDGQGALTLDVGGSVLNTSTTTAYSGGTFNPRDAYLLTYTINTTTGDITNISLEGSTANYASLETASDGYFVSSAITNVDFGTNDRDADGQGGGYIGGDYADLDVSAGAVPEPSTWALMSAGVLVLGVLTIRRRQHQV